MEGFSLHQIKKKKTIMKNILAIIAIITLSVTSLIAINDNAEAPVTTTTLSGQVFDKATGESLAGVKIIVDENATEVYTDLDGNFTITNISTGSHNIKADLISYKSHDKNIEITPSANNLKVEIEIDNN